MSKHSPVDFDIEKDLVVHEDRLADDSPIFEREYRFGVGENQRYTTVAQWRGYFEDIFKRDGPLYPHYESEKAEGYWLLSGMTVPQAKAEKSTQAFAHKGWGERKDDKMDECQLMMFDFDQGGPLETIIQRLRKHNVAAIIYTTHSHGKTFSDDATVNKIANTQHKTGITDIDAAVRSYFLKEKNFDKRIVDSMEITTDPIDHEGRQYYPVTHMPMPKYRVILFLKEPFSFRMLDQGITATQRIKDWRTFYEKTAGFFGFSTADSSCKNPARLMYAPQFKPGQPLGDIFEFESDHGIGYLDGDFYDAEILKGDILGNISDQVPSNVRTKTTKKDHVSDYVTPDLKEFFRAHRHDFQIVECIRTERPDVVFREVNSDKIEIRCPRDAYHTDQNRTDGSAAWCKQDGPDGEGWIIRCQTYGCGGEPGPTGKGGGYYYNEDLGFFDKLQMLDDLIQEFGLVDKSAWELEEYCDEPVRKDDGTIAQLLASIDENTLLNDESLKCVIRRIVELEDPAEQAAFEVELVGKFSHGTKGKVTDLIKTEKKRLKAVARAEKRVEVPNEPVVKELDGNPHLFLYSSQGKNVHMTALSNWIADREVDTSDPSVFIGTDGELRWVCKADGDRPARLEIMEAKEWRAWTSKWTTMVRVTHDDMIEDHMPDRTADSVWLSRDLRQKMKYVKGVASLPLFGPSGKLITQEGYNEDTKMYFVPNAQFLEVPEVPTLEDVDKAWAIIVAATRDFPFSDDFTFSETNPKIYTGEPVEGAPGFFEPNLDRGYSSRLHTVAAMLTPIVREMIDGPKPGFLISKPAAGTGATNLVKLFTFVLEGRDVPFQPFPQGNDEELMKAMLPDLQEGRPMIAYDNINHHTKIDSPALAGVMTSGFFKGRVLGKSKMAEAETASTFVFAGNQVDASGEVTRRLIPILLDAGHGRPAARKALVPMDKWARENRERFIWSLHVLVQNWIAKGRPPFSAVEERGTNLATFSSWVQVIGGILEASGHERGQFLAAYDNFIAEELDEYANDERLMRFIWHTFKDKDFTFNATDFLQEMYISEANATRPLVDGFELVTERGNVTSRAVGKTLRTLKGVVFTLNGHDVKIAGATNKRFKLIAVDASVDLHSLDVPRDWH